MHDAEGASAKFSGSSMLRKGDKAIFFRDKRSEGAQLTQDFPKVCILCIISVTYYCNSALKVKLKLARFTKYSSPSCEEGLKMLKRQIVILYISFLVHISRNCTSFARRWKDLLATTSTALRRRSKKRTARPGRENFKVSDGLKRKWPD